MSEHLSHQGRLLVFWSLLAGFFVVSCTPITDPARDSDGAQLAKASAGPTVSSVLPSYAHPGDVSVAVSVLGTRFDQGSVASWERNGVTDPKVSVLETRFVSSSELVATISVAGDATIDLYDVAVTTSTRKKGVGMEKFAVTVAQSIGSFGGNTLARAINDQGAVVGYSMKGTSQRAFFAAPGAAMTDLGAGQAYDLDATASTIVGVASGAGVIWENGSGSWIPSPLLLPVNGTGARATNMATTADGLVIGGSVTIAVSSNKSEGRPALWRKANGVWTVTTYPIPTGYASAWLEDVNVLGQGVGVAREPYSKAYFWDSDGTATALTPLSGDRSPFAYGINPAGTLIVGSSSGRAVYWRRASSTGSWSPAVTLEACGRAMDVNSAGMIVGQGCEDATLWVLDAAGNVTRSPLIGLGANSDAPAVEGINNAASPAAAGSAKAQGSSTTVGVIWNLPALSAE